MCQRHLLSTPDEGKKCLFPGFYDELLRVKGGLNVSWLENEKDHFSNNVYKELECSALSSGRLEMRGSSGLNPC